MGHKRRESSDKLKLRLNEPVEDRDTLVPCPACGGNGMLLYEYKTGPYKQKKCGWCDGQKYTDSSTVGMFVRWTKILRCNYDAGLCEIIRVTTPPHD